MKTGSTGIVRKKFHTLGAPGKSERIRLDSGTVFGPVTVAFETWGELNERKDNAILIQHTLTMDAHAAGVYEEGGKPGWWDGLIGPGKPFDTDKYFVVCSNIFGGCAGSTGPSSVDPEREKPYGAGFPFFTFSDIVRIQRKWLRSLEVRSLFSVAGGSMGGMLALQWVSDFPEAVRSVIPIACAWKQSPMQIAFSEIGRQSVINDPDWREGSYYGHGNPVRGLSLARMIGHITYMSEKSMEKKFSRNLLNGGPGYSLKADFEVEDYLHYRGRSFVDRFDANSYLYISKALNYFDVSGDRLGGRLEGKKISFLIISFESDWLYPPWQSEEIVRYLMSKNVDTSYCRLRSDYGHDAFLLEIEEEAKLIRSFLRRIENEK